jgi:3-hydroxymyristoyl/3-hydroxydecanoyl-(acyl carrier protein) dehydratase
MDGRFSSPVIPGEKLEIRVWEEKDHFKFRTTVGDRVVLDNGVLQTR